jgi:hypothetical protein
MVDNILTQVNGTGFWSSLASEIEDDPIVLSLPSEDDFDIDAYALDLSTGRNLDEVKALPVMQRRSTELLYRLDVA